MRLRITFADRERGMIAVVDGKSTDHGTFFMVGEIKVPKENILPDGIEVLNDEETSTSHDQKRNG